MKEYKKPNFFASTRGPRAAFPAAIVPAIVAVAPVAAAVANTLGGKKRESVRIPSLTPVMK